MTVEPVGPIHSLFERLLASALGGPVALGVDFPIGVPRAYAARHCAGYEGFPSFLRSLRDRPEFFQVAETLDEVGPNRPFFPRVGQRGMTRLSHALALGLAGPTDLSRVCDRATAERPAGAPLFWTLGANQSGKAAICAWRDLLLPAQVGLWPFEGPFRALLQPGRVTVAETYPAEAMRQVGLRRAGSKRRQADRLRLSPGLQDVMTGLRVQVDERLGQWLLEGFGHDAAGEDRLDCLLGLLCVLSVLDERRPDTAPADHWIERWEGWVLGQVFQPR